MGASLSLSFLCAAGKRNLSGLFQVVSSLFQNPPLVKNASAKAPFGGIKKNEKERQELS